MNGWLLEQEIDLSQPISRQYTSPYGIALTGDDRAQRLRYMVYDGQDDADLSGTVKVYYRRPDDTLIESTSGGDYVTVSGNIVTAELPPEAYEQKGTVECLVKLYASDGKVVTLARCDIEVRRGGENDETIIPAGEASRASLEHRVAALEVATGVVLIDQLPDLPHDPQTGDYLEVEDGNGPYKIDYVALADAIIARAAANNLTTTIAGKLLDARQGVNLNNIKFDKAKVYNGLDKTVEGFALDARQGKALKDIADALSDRTDALAASVSDAYDSTATYTVGDYCIHDDVLYRCSTAIATAEEWDETHWTAVTVTDAIAQSTATGQKSVVSLTNINTNITINDSYRVGVYGGTIAILFTIITVITQVPAWTRLCTIADSNMMPAFNNQRWVLANGTSSAVIYLNTNGSIETQTILPTGTYYAAIVYIRNNA